MKLDLLTLVSAMATQEGYYLPNSVPAKCLNPTDLRFAGQRGSLPSNYGGSMPFAQFTHEGIGVAAAIRQICAYIQDGLSLRQLIWKWAPPSDGNNSEAYLNETQRRIKEASGVLLDVDAPLHTYLIIQRIP